MAKRKSRRKRAATSSTRPDTSAVLSDPADAAASNVAVSQTPDPVVLPDVKPLERPWRRTALAATAAFLIGAAVMWGVMAVLLPSPERPVRKFQLLIPGQVPQNKATAISPDGLTIAYVSDSRLWLRDVGELTPRMIPDSEGVALPFWSPDSDRVGYYNAPTGALYAVSLNDETPVLLADIPTRGIFGGATWNRAGEIVFSLGPSGLFKTEITSGTTTTLLTPDQARQDAGFYAPHFLPDGKTCIFAVWQKDGVWALDMLTLPGRRSRIMTASDGELITAPVYAASGHLLYNRAQGGTQGIWAVPFSTDPPALSGKPFLLTEEGNWPSVSLDHTLVYETTVGKQEQQLVWVNRDGATIGPIGPPQPGLSSPAVSPKDDLVAVAGRDKDRWDLWLYDVTQGDRSRLTYDARQESHPAWSGEGDRLVFSSVEDDSTWIMSLTTDGTRELETLVGMPLDDPAPTWSRDGYFLVYQMLDEASGASDLWYIPLQEEDRTPVRFTDTPTDEALPRFSPDGRYLAYQSNESGIWEVYVTPFPEGNRTWTVSFRGGMQPRWSYWSEELFYVRGDDLMAVPIRTSARFYTLAIPQRLLRIEGVADNPLMPAYDISSDGQRIILIRDGVYTSETTVTVVMNWGEAVTSDK